MRQNSQKHPKKLREKKRMELTLSKLISKVKSEPIRTTEFNA